MAQPSLGFSPKAVWTQMLFYPLSVERLLSKHWTVGTFLIFSPPTVVAGFYGTSFHDRLTFFWSIYTDGFVLSLLLACLIAGAFIAYWESNFRRTFGNAIEDGLVRGDEEGIATYRRLSEEFQTLTSSNKRILVWPVMLAFVALVNFQQLSWSYQLAALAQKGVALSICDQRHLAGTLAIVPIQLILSYVGAMFFWTIAASAVWLSRLSTSSCLEVQMGHSDNCCGLADIGLCSLQSAVPLVVGMLLLTLWAYGHHIKIFEHHVNPDFIDFVRTYDFGLLAILFCLACALVFLPTKDLHKRLQEYKRGHDKEFSTLLRQQLELTRAFLPENDDVKTKYLADRLKLVLSFDPVVLKLATWPFDRAALTRYGVTPVLTLLATPIKKVIESHILTR